MNRLALDLGLTKMGWCTGPTEWGHIKIPNREVLTPMDDVAKQKRLRWWLYRLNGFITSIDPDHIDVEEAVMNPKNPTGAIETYRLHGVLATVCITKGIPLRTVNNQTLKSKALGSRKGKGRATKDTMREAAEAITGVAMTEDEADAFHLYRIVEEGLI